MTQTIGVALLGCGTVGSGVVHFFSEHQESLARASEGNLRLAYVLVRDWQEALQNTLNEKTEAQQTTDYATILSDSSVSIVIEAIGGTTVAYDYVQQALRAGKHVVTANKDMIATYGPQLHALAQAHGCTLSYEASVAGGVPILRTLATSLSAESIESVSGIVNGTTNFMLDKMSNEEWTYEQALQEAQRLGFAEADPTNDVAGYDAAYKLVILTAFAFRQRVSRDDIAIQGITDLKPEDSRAAKELGYTIKLVATAQNIDGKIFLRVSPTWVPNQHVLATVSAENNGVVVTGKHVGTLLFYGPGAGSHPTAHAIISDVVQLAKQLRQTQVVSSAAPDEIVTGVLAEAPMQPYAVRCHQPLATSIASAYQWQQTTEWVDANGAHHWVGISKPLSATQVDQLRQQQAVVWPIQES